VKSLALIFSLVLVASCAQAEISVTQHKIRPGEVRWLEFPLKQENPKLFCRDHEVKYVQQKDKGLAFIMESYFSDLTPFKCVLKSQGKILAEMQFSVEDREYLAEVLKVDPKKIKLSPKDEARVLKEQAVLNQIYASSVPLFLFTQPFAQPMGSVITSVYGTRRVYNKKKKGQHLGIDYRAAIGDKVPAANAGKVVFSGDLFYTGWTVIIDHGVDIFTVYGHLSKTMVEAGQVVKRGDLIGLSGNTGRTSGPHLHWGVKVQGQYIDGLVLIEETKKYFRD
jgi:murein DD-endopeptidase MepM/ murein hydrolase activator NlpD